MKIDKSAMLLYAVTDSKWCADKTLVWQVERAICGGATCIQLREKNLDEAAFLEKAIEIKKLCGKYGVPFIINDNVNIALKCGADGIHIGQHDMKLEDVRSILGEGIIIGMSAQTEEQARRAEALGADYLGVGAVFSTTTKLDANLVSHKTLRDICAAVSIPIVAIGGINKGNILSLRGTGVDGAALVSAIFAADDIESECRELCRLSREMIS